MTILNKFKFFFIFNLLGAFAPVITYAQAPNPCLFKRILPEILSQLTVYEINPASNLWNPVDLITACSQSIQTPQSLHNSEPNKNLKQKLLSALFFMYTIEMYSSKKSNAPNLIFEEGALSFLKKRIKSIFIEPKSNNTCQTKTVAYVSPQDTNSLHLCDKSVPLLDSDFKLSYTLIHEARHIDGFTHSSCTRGRVYELTIQKKASFSKACDEDYGSQGSYGVGAAFAIEVAHRSTNPSLRNMARELAIEDLLSRFNQLPFGINEGSLLVDQNSQTIFYPTPKLNHSAISPDITQKETIILPREKPSWPHLNLLKAIKSPLAIAKQDENILFFNSTGEVYIYSYSPLRKVTQGVLARSYSANYRQNPDNSLLDAIALSSNLDYHCLLHLQQLDCYDLNSTKHQILFTKIKAHSFYLVKDNITRNESLYLVTNFGVKYKMPNQFSELAKISEADFLKLPKSHFKGDYFNLNLTLQDEVQKFITNEHGNLIKPLKMKNKSGFYLGEFYWSAKLESI